MADLDLVEILWEEDIFSKDTDTKENSATCKVGNHTVTYKTKSQLVDHLKECNGEDEAFYRFRVPVLFAMYIEGVFRRRPELQIRLQAAYAEELKRRAEIGLNCPFLQDLRKDSLAKRADAAKEAPNTDEQIRAAITQLGEDVSLAIGNGIRQLREPFQTMATAQNRTANLMQQGQQNTNQRLDQLIGVLRAIHVQFQPNEAPPKQWYDYLKDVMLWGGTLWFFITWAIKPAFMKSMGIVFETGHHFFKMGKMIRDFFEF